MGALLDRDAELSELGRRLEAARAGSGRVIVVEGPAGIGKSTLLTAAGGMARDAGMTVLSARCSPLEQHAAWGAARQVFEPLRSRPDWAALTVGAARLAERALAPEEGEPAPVGDAMHSAVRGLVWLTSLFGERGPALLAVDDVHWADAPSLRWLAILAQTLGDLPVAVLCALRSGDPAGAPELVAEVLAAAPEPPVRPRALGPAAIETLVRQRLTAATPAFAHACHAVTGGNPFLLGALLTQVAADAVAPDDHTAARLERFGSEQVARVLERRLARLPAGAGALARAACVLGPGAHLRHAAALARLDLTQAARAADGLRAAGLFDAGPGLTLTHPMIAGTLYADLGAGERALLHAHAAAQLAHERAGAELVALHLLRAEPQASAETVRLLRAAATSATARGAPESAATYLRRAIAEPPPGRGDEAEVRFELGIALAGHAPPNAPAVLAEAVELSATGERRAEIALAGARALGLAGCTDHAFALCRRGLEHTGHVAPELRGRLEAELIADAWLNASTVGEARERMSRLRSSPPPLQLWRINAAWESICDARPATEARALLASALDAGALDDDADSLLGTFVKFVLIASGDFHAARRHCAGLIDFARPRGWAVALAHGSFLRAIALHQAGLIRDAEGDARLAFDFKLANSLPAAVIWGVFPLLDALTELGELDDADAVLTAAGLLDDPPTGALAAPMLLESRGRLRLGQHRPADARADLLAAADRWHALEIRHPGLAAWRVDASEALVALGELPAARELAEDHLELAERVGLPGPRGAGLRALARTVGREEAISLLERAVDLLARSPAQLEHTRALLELGAALRRANRRAAAREPLRRALDIADRGGMRVLARRAREELNAAGTRPRRSALSGPSALTPAEHRVTRLAADGHSNRAIAEQLYVTQRTVETHLTHAFQKLGIGSRGELGPALDPNTVSAGRFTREGV